MDHDIALRIPTITPTAHTRLAAQQATRRRRSRAARRASIRTAFLMCGLALSIVAAAALPGLGAPSAGVPAATTTLRVTAGDTLWDIAEDFATVDTPTHVVVDHLIELNSLEEPTLVVGSVLEVPVLELDHVASR